MEGAWRNERMLLKVAALLVALSLLAERAAGRSFPVRFLLLAILWRAEAVARAFVTRETPADWPDLDETPGMRGHPVEAAWLAMRLRMLAAILCDLVAAACHSVGDSSCAGFVPGGSAPVLLFVFPARRPLPPHDTS
jgi:hypothetical protein